MGVGVGRKELHATLLRLSEAQALFSVSVSQNSNQVCIPTLNSIKSVYNITGCLPEVGKMMDWTSREI